MDTGLHLSRCLLKDSSCMQRGTILHTQRCRPVPGHIRHAWQHAPLLFSGHKATCTKTQAAKKQAQKNKKAKDGAGEDEEEDNSRLRIPLTQAQLEEAEEFAELVLEKRESIGEVGSQQSRRSMRSTKGSQAQDEYEEIEKRVLEGATFENIFPGVPMFSDPEEPQWFALQVAMPEPKQANKVVRLLQTGLKQLPGVTLPSGQVINREMEVLSLKKKVKAFSLNTRKMSTRTVTWKNGSYVLFKAIMDSKLAEFLEPHFDVEEEFWSKKLKRMPGNLLSNYVGGVYVKEQHVHVPRPCPEEFLAEIREWEALDEEWDEKHVLKLEYGNNIPSEMLPPEERDAAIGQEFEERLYRGHAFKAQRKDFTPGRDPIVEQERKRRALKVTMKNSVREMQDQMMEKELRDLRKLDAGGWNVGTVSFRRTHREPRRPAIEEDGDAVPWQPEVARSFQNPGRSRDHAFAESGYAGAPQRSRRAMDEWRGDPTPEEESPARGRGEDSSRIRLPGRLARNGRSGTAWDSISRTVDDGRADDMSSSWYTGGRSGESATREGGPSRDRAGWFTGGKIEDSSLAGTGAGMAKADRKDDDVLGQWSEEWFGDVDDQATGVDLGPGEDDLGKSSSEPFSSWEKNSFNTMKPIPEERNSAPRRIRREPSQRASAGSDLGTVEASSYSRPADQDVRLAPRQPRDDRQVGDGGRSRQSQQGGEFVRGGRGSRGGRGREEGTSQPRYSERDERNTRFAGRGRGRDGMQSGKGLNRSSRKSEDSYSSGGWYEGSSQMPNPAPSTSSGWGYDAAAALRDQYSRPQQDSSSGWYQGPAGDSTTREVPQWSDPGWESGRTGRHPSQSEPADKDDSKLPRWDSPIDPAVQQAARSTASPNEWSQLMSDLAAETSAEPLQRRGTEELQDPASDDPRKRSPARELGGQDHRSDKNGSRAGTGRGARGERGGLGGRGGRGGSARGRAENRYGGRGYGEQEELVSSWQTSAPQRVEVQGGDDDLDWDNFANSAPAAPSAAAAGFSKGVGVSVTGGRYKGMAGEVLTVRGGVVRVALSGAQDVPAEVELPATDCSARD